MTKITHVLYVSKDELAQLSIAPGELTEPSDERIQKVTISIEFEPVEESSED